jgi:hypothetical protein
MHFDLEDLKVEEVKKHYLSDKTIKRRLVMKTKLGIYALVIAISSSLAVSVMASEKGMMSAKKSMMNHEGMKMTEMCPMNVKGTKVKVSKTDKGIAMTFKTKSKNVDELRKKVKAMSQMHAKHQKKSGKMTDKEMHHMKGEKSSMMSSKKHESMTKHRAEAEKHSSKKDMHMMGKSGEMMKMHKDMIMIPSSEVSYEETKKGARLVFLTEDDSKLDELRENVNKCASTMKKGECPMMKMMMEEDESGDSKKGLDSEDKEHKEHH